MIFGRTRFFGRTCFRPERRVAAAGVGVLVIVLAVTLGVIGWRHYRTSDPLKNLKPGVYEPKAKSSGEKLPLPAPAKK